ncbi:hypothetical protein JHW43_000300 [Diplocarpon mali]|nr:hypothetical protein JHW43_000300 [Diplocarpon mali]
MSSPKPSNRGQDKRLAGLGSGPFDCAHKRPHSAPGLADVPTRTAEKVWEQRGQHRNPDDERSMMNVTHQPQHKSCDAGQSMETSHIPTPHLQKSRLLWGNLEKRKGTKGSFGEYEECFGVAKCFLRFLSPSELALYRNLASIFVFNWKESSKTIRVCSASFQMKTKAGWLTVDLRAANSSSGGVYGTLFPVPDGQVKSINDEVEWTTTLGNAIVGEESYFGPNSISAKSEGFQFGKISWELSRKWLEESKVKVHKPRANKYGEGLDGVLKGLHELRKGKGDIKIAAVSKQGFTELLEVSCPIHRGATSLAVLADMSDVDPSKYLCHDPGERAHKETLSPEGSQERALKEETLSPSLHELFHYSQLCVGGCQYCSSWTQQRSLLIELVRQYISLGVLSTCLHHSTYEISQTLAGTMPQTPPGLPIQATKSRNPYGTSTTLLVTASLPNCLQSSMPIALKILQTLKCPKLLSQERCFGGECLALLFCRLVALDVS